MKRRQFLAGAGSLALLPAAARSSPRRASLPLPWTSPLGARIGDVGPDSALVHVRLCAVEARNDHGQTIPIVGRGEKSAPMPEGLTPNDLQGACPGAAGRVRLTFGTSAALDGAKKTPWVAVGERTDFSHAFSLAGLSPSTEYHYTIESAAPSGALGAPTRLGTTGRFRTAPRPDESTSLTFAVLTCQRYRDRDHDEGFRTYRALANLDLAFVAMTGDNVYYDSDPPLVRSVALARHHWHRMNSLPSVRSVFDKVPTYWMKDDHDVLSDDAWPGLKVPAQQPFTFADGQRVFREQVPVGRPYRRFRWGRALEVWFLEGRDFRSPNTDADGPRKTIWGTAQREWLEKTLLASDATYRIIVSPTPIVGPDRSKGKDDNHANAAFAHEGNAFRRFLHERARENVFILCGDRHWQYHSKDPDTGLEEFAAGPVSDGRAGGSPGEDPKMHLFHRQKGGFLTVGVATGPAGGKPEIVIRHHDVDGNVLHARSTAS